uniref:Uncharacterized protein n=1 Tax=Arundo donax TaxID=35708 RepID=A0A0A8YF12_ARUDO
MCLVQSDLTMQNNLKHLKTIPER